jgi:hypothetical protein
VSPDRLHPSPIKLWAVAAVYVNVIILCIDHSDAEKNKLI